MATAGARRVETLLTVKDVLDTASSEGLRMTTEKAEGYLIYHCVSLWYSHAGVRPRVRPGTP
ncbi:MAG: hypothetical protein ACLPSO_13095 [Terracidiphilus sp.]